MTVEHPTAPRFVLVRPQMGENIGAAARAMLNFGLGHMAVVAPRDGWPNPAAVAMASGAGRVLDAALLAPDLPAAIGDCSFVFATTARDRDMSKPVYTPEAAMALTAQKIAAGERVAVLFGPERAGLENEDIARANAIISVPVNPDFASLNLAQCVLLVGYEWMRQHSTQVAVAHELAGSSWADQSEIEHLAKHYEERMEDAGFFYPEHKAASMKTNLRNMWSRLPLTRADVQILHGTLRQMVRWKERG
ncbi:MAG: RNA methyltransferase [Sulfitobacter sp.]